MTRMTSGLAHLTSRALIKVDGPDWRSFLQGLITQDVTTLGEGDLVYGALLTPQGRLLHDLFVFGDDAAGVLDVSAVAREVLIDKLNLYRLRAKVQIRRFDDAVLAAWGPDPPATAGPWRRDPRLPHLGWRAAGPIEAATDPLSLYEAHRLALGVPDPEIDGKEADYPIELNLDALKGIDFHKGCFVGQETTSRMHRRGAVKTRMAPIAFAGSALPFGAEILAGDRRAGEVRGGVDGRALALLRIDRIGGDALTVDGLPIAVDLPPWLKPLFVGPADEAP